MTKWTTVGILLACGVVFSGPPLAATVLVPASLGELARDAGLIVRGRVLAAEARFTPDRRAIETLVTVEAEATLKGPAGPTVQLLVPGGRLGRYRSLFVGAPEFVAGQRVVVFLGWHAPSYPYVLGLSQGVFRIQSDGDRQSVVVPPPIAAPAIGTARVVRGDLVRRPVPLADFEQRVRMLVAEAR
jgi:hypothetical protein